MLKKFIDKVISNPFDALVKKAASRGKYRFLVVWNRGLGDIPLGLYALVHRLREIIPHASITFLTRVDLAPAFEMLHRVHVLPCPNWERGKPIDIRASLKEHLLSTDRFDVVLENVNPTKWFKWQLGSLTPALSWQNQFDLLAKRYNLKKDETYIGVHIDTETGDYYGYNKNWPLSSWKALFNEIEKNQKGKIILFGLKKTPLALVNGIDLRGDTSLFEMLAIIKNHCNYLVLPDSGILSLAYYTKADFVIRVVSLWADPHQGILRQKVNSPNKQFKHIPLIGQNHCIDNISSQSVYQALFGDYGKDKTSTCLS